MQKMLSATREQAQNGGDYDYKHVMIDKSPTEVAAIREACGGEKHLFCYFHFLQEWERFARSAKGGVKEDVQRADLLTDLSTLAKNENGVVFRETEQRFCQKWQQYPEVVENYKANWATCAKHWAHFGRADILDLCRDTNNHLERFQGIFKYDFLDRNTKNSIPTLIQKICTEVVPRYVNDRAEKLGRGRVAVAVAAQAKKEQSAAELVASNALSVKDSSIGLVQVAATIGVAQAGYYTVCLAELSCTCPDHMHFKTACKHIQAVQLSELVPGFTHGMRLEAAGMIIDKKALMPVDGSTAGTIKLYQCPALRDINKAVAQGAFTISMHETYCSCLGFKLHGGCCHLIAASRMPEGDGVVSTVAWHGMDTKHELAVIPTPVTGHPEIEPLTDDVYQYMCKVHQVVPQSVLEHNVAASTAMSQLAQRWQTLQRAVKGLSSQQQDEVVKDMDALVAKYTASAAGAGLPHTNKQLSADVTKHWNRQAYHIKTRALFKARTRNILKRFSATQQGMLGRRTDTLVAGLQQDVLATSVVMDRLPTRQEAGAPRKFVGIAAGRFGKRGGNAHGKKVPKKLRGTGSMAASAAVGGEGNKSRRKQQRSKKQKSKVLS